MDGVKPVATYTNPTETYTSGTAITAFSPTTTHTDIASYVVKSDSSLPSGLALNATTGEITGTPDTIDADTHDTVIVVTDTAGNTNEVTVTFPAIEAPTAPPTRLTLYADDDGYTRPFNGNISESFNESAIVVIGELNAPAPAGGVTVTLALATDAGTATEGETCTEAGADYTLAITEFTIPAGKTIDLVNAYGTIQFCDDSRDEADETIHVTATTDTASIVTVDPVTVTILDEDGEAIGVVLSLPLGATLQEDSNANARVEARLTGGTRTSATDVSVTVADGTATSPADYSASPSSFTITIPADTLSATAEFDPGLVDDAIDEGDETVLIQGTTTVGLTVTGTTMTIVDNDGMPTVTLSLTADTIAESGTGNSTTVQASLSAASTAETTVTVAPLAGAYTVSGGGVLTIPANALYSTGTVTITAVDNDVYHGPAGRTVAVSATASNTAGVTAPDDVTLTITDDDTAPTAIALSVDTDSVAAGAQTDVDEGDSATVTVTAAFPQGSASLTTATTVTVTVGGTGSTTTSGTDYTAVASFDVTIPAEATSGTATFTLATTEDTADEGAGEVVRLAGAAQGFTVSAADITITDDDGAPTGISLAVDTDAVTTGDQHTVDEDGTQQTVTVRAALEGGTTRTEATAVTVTVAAGTATLTRDYAVTVADPFTITIPAGSASATGTFTITPVDDDIDEANETVSVTGTNADPGLTVTAADPALTITDAEATPTATLTLTPSSISENGGVSTVTATLSGASSAATTITVAASAGNYTVSQNAVLTIAAEATTSTGTVTLTAVDDDVDGPDREVDVTATAANTVGVTGPADATLTITDDDTAGITVTLPTGQTALTTTEAGGTDTFTVVLDSEPTADVTIGVSSDDTTEGTVAPATLTFTSGNWSTAQTVTVTGVDDAVDDGDVSYSIVLAAAQSGDTNYNGVDPDDVSASNTDDDAAPTAISLRLDPATVTEGGGAQTVTVHADVDGTTTFGSATEVTVTVSAGTATVTDDYAVSTAPGTITIAAGAATGSTTFAITPVDDTIVETDGETVTVGGESGSLTVNAATLTISDDDTAPTKVTLSVDTATVAEDAGTGAATITATLDAAAQPGGVTVTLTAAGTATGGGTDYTLSSTTITIAAGATEGTATLDIVDDTVDDDAETIEISATASGGLTVEGSPVTVTITDNDAAPVISIAAQPVDEDAGSTTLTVTRTGDLSGASSASYAFTDGTATGGGTDYTGTDGTVTFAASEASQTIPVTIVQDTIDEGAGETFTVTLSAPSGATLGADPETATITITDDDDAPTGISLAVDTDADTANDQNTVAEDGTAQTVTVRATLEGGTTRTEATAVTVTVAAGTATLTTDYAITTAPGTITIAAGAATGSTTFAITPVDDNVFEGNETVAVTGSTTVQGLTVSAADPALTITNADAAPASVALSADVSEVDEGDGDVEVTMTVEFPVDGSTFGRDLVVSVFVRGVAPTGQRPATEDEDFSAPQRGGGLSELAITIPEGAHSASASITLTIVDDAVSEGDEYIAFNGLNNAFIAVSPRVYLPIRDNEATPTATLVLTPSSISENGGVSTVTATLSGASDEATTLTVSAAPVSPAVAGDFTLSTDTELTIAAGATTSTGTVTITAVDNSVDAADKTVTVSATATNDVGVTAPTSQTLTITDDDVSAAPGKVTGLTATGVSHVQIDISWTATATATKYQYRYGATSGSLGSWSADETETSASLTGLTANTTYYVQVRAGNDGGYGDPSDEASATTQEAPAPPTRLTLHADEAGYRPPFTPTVRETAEGTTPSTFVVLGELNTPAPAGGVTVTVAVAADPGTATSGTDYTLPASLSFTIPAGETIDTGAGVVVVAVTDDTEVEGSETINFTATTDTASIVTVDPVTVTILDDDGTPTGVALSVSPVQNWGEGSTENVSVTATLLGGTRSEATVVTVTVSDGTATSPADYAAVADFTITIPANTLSAQGGFDPNVVDDTVVEGDETITLSGSTTAAVGLPVTGTTLTIADNDGAVVSLSLTADEIAESGTGNSTTVQASLSAASTVETTVTVAPLAGAYTVSGGGVLTIPANALFSTGSVTITAVDNDVYHGAAGRTVAVSATASAGVRAPDDVTLTITEDDTAPTAIALSVDTDSVTAGAQTDVDEGDSATVTVTAAFPQGSASLTTATTVTVTVGGTGSTATSGTDYTAVAAFDVTIPAEATSGTATFTLATTEDTDDEGTGETVRLAGTASGFTVSDADITIADDDGAPTGISLAVDTDADTAGDQNTVAEDGTAQTVTVRATLEGGTTRTTATAVTVTVAAGTATATTDYSVTVASPFTITIPASAASATGTFTITPVDDAIDEPDETLAVTGSTTVQGLTVTAADPAP